MLRDAHAAAGGYSTLQTITYVDYPINRTTVAQWAAAGKNPAELFEAVGGGHPSQTSHALTAAAVWAALEARAPAALGPVNPNNAEIAKRMGIRAGISVAGEHRKAVEYGFTTLARLDRRAAPPHVE